jgi:hypothetical protein
VITSVNGLRFRRRQAEEWGSYDGRAVFTHKDYPSYHIDREYDPLQGEAIHRVRTPDGEFWFLVHLKKTEVPEGAIEYGVEREYLEQNGPFQEVWQDILPDEARRWLAQHNPKRLDKLADCNLAAPVHAEGARPEKYSDTQQKILDVLRKADGPLPAKIIAQRADCREDYVRRCANGKLKDRIIHVEGQGYTLR